MASLQNKLRPARSEVGVSQQELASRAGISRQAYMAIESGRSAPSTEVALRLARSLGQTVEQLFSLDDDEEVTVEADLMPGGSGGDQPGRVEVAQVGERLIAMPLSGRSAAMHALWPAGGTVAGDATPGKVPVRLIEGERLRVPSIVMAGCDPTIGFLAEEVAAKGARLLWSERSSKAGLQALARGEAHIAGCHLFDEITGSFNRPWVRRIVPEACTVVRFAVWREGIIVAPGNPKEITRADDLARPGVRIVNRQAGSGSRATLDQMLHEAGVPKSLVSGYELETHGHIQVAEAVAQGFADAGIGVEAAARAFGLGFVPVNEEPYDLVVPDRHINERQVQALLDALRGQRIRRQLSALGGYDTSEMGLPA
jgi:molybdate-binding protein/DNA-binding XRE family transcriptional regulator